MLCSKFETIPTSIFRVTAILKYDIHVHILYIIILYLISLSLYVYFSMQCLKKWGFRRCEDICWVKTNMNDPGNTTHLEQKSIFQHTKVHELHVHIEIQQD